MGDETSVSLQIDDPTNKNILCDVSGKGIFENFNFEGKILNLGSAFVYLQLCLFASYRYASVNYTWDNKITFSHLFIKDWDTSREITSYPPTTGPLAVYTKADFYSYFDHAVHAVRAKL